MHTFHWIGHSESLLRGIKELYDSCENVDCVLECDGGLLRGHRVVLAASSGYLRNIFKEHETTLYVPLKEVKFQCMQKILHFVYNGSVNVPSDQVPDVMKTAYLLEITPLHRSYFTEFLGNSSKKNCKLLENPSIDAVISTNDELHFSKCSSWSKNKKIAGEKEDEENIEELEVQDKGMDRFPDLSIVKEEGAETEGELNVAFLEVTLPSVKHEEVCEEGGNEDVACPDPLKQEKPCDGESCKSEQKTYCGLEIKTKRKIDDQKEVKSLLEKSDSERSKRAERICEVIQVKKEQDGDCFESVEKSERDNGCIRLKTKSESVTFLKEARVVLERISSATVNKLGVTMINSSVSVESSTRRLVSKGAQSLEGRRNDGHDVRETSICSHCVAVFTSKKEFENHLNTHLKKGEYLCHICGLQYGSKVKLEAHLRFHKQGKRLSCAQCSVTCRSKGILLQHMRTHTGEKPFVCATCSRAFAQLGTLKQHMRTHTGEKPFACATCSRAFAQLGTLKQHIRCQHSGVKPFTCSVCNAPSGDRNRHLHAHCGKKGPRIPCRQCPVSFHFRGDLKKHMMIHTGEKPYICNHCLMRFNRKSILKKHIIRHHIL